MQMYHKHISGRAMQGSEFSTCYGTITLACA